MRRQGQTRQRGTGNRQRKDPYASRRVRIEISGRGRYETGIRGPRRRTGSSQARGDSQERQRAASGPQRRQAGSALRSGRGCFVDADSQSEVRTAACLEPPQPRHVQPVRQGRPLGQGMSPRPRIRRKPAAAAAQQWQRPRAIVCHTRRAFRSDEPSHRSPRTHGWRTRQQLVKPRQLRRQ